MSPKLISRRPPISCGCFLGDVGVYIIRRKFKSSKIWNGALFFDSFIYWILLLNSFFFVCVLYFLSFFRSSFKFTDRDRVRERERERGGGGPHFWRCIYIWIPPSRHRSIPCQRRYQPVDTTIHILLAYRTRLLVAIQKTWLNICYFFFYESSVRLVKSYLLIVKNILKNTFKNEVWNWRGAYFESRTTISLIIGGNDVLHVL